MFWVYNLYPGDIWRSVWSGWFYYPPTSCSFNVFFSIYYIVLYVIRVVSCVWLNKYWQRQTYLMIEFWGKFVTTRWSLWIVQVWSLGWGRGGERIMHCIPRPDWFFSHMAWLQNEIDLNQLGSIAWRTSAVCAIYQCCIIAHNNQSKCARVVDTWRR